MDARDDILKEYIVAETLRILSGETKIEVSESDKQFSDLYIEKPKVRTKKKEVSTNGRKNDIYN